MDLSKCIKSLSCPIQFLVGLVLYLPHFLLTKLHPPYNYHWIRWYAGDFLALIVCAPLFTNFQIILKVRTDTFIKLWEIGVYWLLFSLVFEVFSPFVLKKGHADIWDVVVYGAGGLLLYFSQLLGGKSEIFAE